MGQPHLEAVGSASSFVLHFGAERKRGGVEGRSGDKFWRVVVSQKFISECARLSIKVRFLEVKDGWIPCGTGFKNKSLAIRVRLGGTKSAAERFTKL